MKSIIEMINEFLSTGHASVIHFPIIGVMFSFLSASIALFLTIALRVSDRRNKLDDFQIETIKKFISKFEFTSYISIILGELGLIIAAITGFYAAGSISQAINIPLLEFKIRLTIYVFFLLMSPLFFKFYIGVVYQKDVFNDNDLIVPILYTLPLFISTNLIMVIAGAGGKYVFGHSILEIIGLGWIFPK